MKSLKFDITRQSIPEKTFRVASIMGKFDLESNVVTERFRGEINLPDAWSVGLITGPSGSGKTQIARELFPDIYDHPGNSSAIYSAAAVIDDMPMPAGVNEICRAFNSVGFSSPPSWMKPYAALSNGEKMRVDLAALILSGEPLFLYDEFTSVVDRQVARIGSFAIQKAVRKANRQFIAVTCHDDVEAWLLPDWILDTSSMTFRLSEGQKKNRPGLNFTITEEVTRKSDWWHLFSRYHYLSHEHNNAARVFIGRIDGKIAAFCSVQHFPHPVTKNYKKIHRLVVLPDYQGIGIGLVMLQHVAQSFIGQGFRIGITTSSPPLIESLKRNPDWPCKSIKRQGPHGSGMVASNDRLTVTFEFEPKASILG